ncbi:MAG TPA: hypothetical protein VMF13_04035 [Luteitalea sp.]|nr:hypothetical protein [Luteitalea sp.]
MSRTPVRRLARSMRPAVFAALAAGLIAGAGMSGSGQQPIGVFADHADIGEPRHAGSFAYDAATQSYAMSASGANMWANRDEFHYAWKTLTGDFIVQARVEFHGTGVDAHRKAGWVVRANRDADGPYVDGVVHGDGLTSLQYRRSKGAQTEQTELAIKGPTFIQVERKGQTYTFSAARPGERLTHVSIADLALGDEVMVGLALCSHNADVIERATFRDVRIIRPVAEGFRPYRDYIGSVLEVLDVETGHRQEVARPAQPVEAPNWTTDGKALIVNRSGRAEGWGVLERFDLDTRRFTTIDTGAVVRNNNDHVLSFDGTMLGLSDGSPASGGRSTVWTVPVAGGTPKRITTLSPSYLHGWSPDAKSLVFTGGRDNEFDIYVIPSDGSGPERNLTRSPGLDDGPEYSPDGRSIYFNSVRSGTMQVWRMGVDGSNPEQITDDEYNNWFPHLSPDGKWIAMVSFMKDVPPAEHPYYKHVYLRLMPTPGARPDKAASKTARVLAYVYGGQGTMNVPSWSPDGRRLAFVSNTGSW